MEPTLEPMRMGEFSVGGWGGRETGRGREDKTKDGTQEILSRR